MSDKKETVTAIKGFDSDWSCRGFQKAGEDGVKPDVWYILNDDGEFEESEDSADP